MANDLENHVPLNAENPIPLSNYSLDPSHALYLHHSDNPNCSLTNEPLTRENYAQWKRSCEVSLSAKNKMTFVTGEYVKPSISSPYRPLWERCNSVVISWLLHSVDKDIAFSIIYTPQQPRFGKIYHRDLVLVREPKFISYKKK